jgi:ankyrin repeat protein
MSHTIQQDQQFFLAAESGDFYLMEGILGHSAALVRAVNADGWTGLHLAAHYGHREVAALLIAHGADVSARSQNALANQPIHAAAAGRSAAAIIRLLLSRGADVNATQHGGFTALHAAAQNGDAALAAMLLDQGADPNRKADDGRSPVAFSLDAGHLEVAALLRERGAVD